MQDQEVSKYSIVGPGSVIMASVAAILMIAATALFLPSLSPDSESGICFTLRMHLLPPAIDSIAGALLIGLGVVLATVFNKKHSFVKSAEPILAVVLLIVLASNPVNTSYLGTHLAVMIVNLICLDIIMKSYAADNATTSMFAVATYLSLGSMVEYGFLLYMPVYVMMAVMVKILRLKEIVAYLMGLVAPYWVALGLGLISPADFRLPTLLTGVPDVDGSYLLFVFISLGTLSLVGLMMTLNNAMLIYSGNMRVRTFNNIINLLGFASGIFILIDFDNFATYVPTLCFAVSVQISNFFVLRNIPHGSVWLWSLLSLFMSFFVFMLIDAYI